MVRSVSSCTRFRHKKPNKTSKIQIDSEKKNNRNYQMKTNASWNCMYNVFEQTIWFGWKLTMPKNESRKHNFLEGKSLKTCYGSQQIFFHLISGWFQAISSLKGLAFSFCFFLCKNENKNRKKPKNKKTIHKCDYKSWIAC